MDAGARNAQLQLKLAEAREFVQKRGGPGSRHLATRHGRRRGTILDALDWITRTEAEGDARRARQLSNQIERLAARQRELEAAGTAAPQRFQAATKSAVKSSGVGKAESGTKAKAASVEARVASAEAKAARSLGSVAKWGKVGPLDAATFYLDMHAAHFAALEKVSARVALAKDLLNRVSEFENGALELRKAVNTQWTAESELPNYPISTEGFLVGAEELAYAENYYAAAARIANDAMAARSKLNSIIQGWDAVLVQANNAGDFTRKSAWDAVTELDQRFSRRGKGFRAFLEQARDDAGRIEQFARSKQYFAADIVGKWVPPGYTSPEI
jgi:hypothetical protein